MSCGTEAKKTPSEDGFFTTLLEAAGHEGALTGSATRKRRRLLERITELVDASGYNWFVIFADEAQRLKVIEYEWLRDVHDCLERKGIRMITLLVGQPQLLNQKSAFRQSNQTQIVLRFMISEMRFDGLADLPSVAACLQGYDDAVYPEGIEIPMQYFAHTIEIALEANMAQDRPDFKFSPAMWDYAVDQSLFESAITELHLGMPSH